MKLWHMIEAIVNANLSINIYESPDRGWVCNVVSAQGDSIVNQTPNLYAGSSVEQAVSLAYKGCVPNAHELPSEDELEDIITLLLERLKQSKQLVVCANCGWQAANLLYTKKGGDAL